jgi:DnaD/phage-associated family protein
MSDKKSFSHPGVFPADIMYDEDLDSLQRWILTVLFTYTNTHTNSVFPSYETIAKRTGYSRRTVIRVVAQLVDKGYIISKKKRFDFDEKTGKHNRTSNLYSLMFKDMDRDAGRLEKEDDLETGDSQSLHDQEKGGDSQTLVTHSHLGSDSQSPKLSTELSNISTTTTTTDPDLEEVIHVFEKEFARPLNHRECEFIEKMLSERSKELILHAIPIAVVNRVCKVNFVDGIIKNWGEDCKTVGDAMLAQERYENSKKKTNVDSRKRGQTETKANHNEKPKYQLTYD